MNRNNALKRIVKGINACINFSEYLLFNDEQPIPSSRLVYSDELPLALQYLEKVAAGSHAVSQGRVLYISCIIKSCARDMKSLGFELLAEETSEVADELVEIYATAEAAEHVSA